MKFAKLRPFPHFRHRILSLLSRSIVKDDAMPFRLSTSLSLAVVVFLTGTAQAAEAPPIKRVTLSTAGLADIERAGPVSGPLTLSLPIPIESVDDLLKTLVIQDPAGPPRSVRLPGQEPFAQEFRNLPFDPADLERPASLLAALRGAEVTVGGARSLSGKIFGVAEEMEQLGNGQSRQRNRLTLLTPQGMDSVILEEASQIAFVDPALRAQVERALSASLRHRARERRVAEIVLSGGGEREVSLSYVIAAPLWKPSYRLLLPASGDKAQLQGWAVLENMTGGDWTDVTLALTSGNPATYRQALYQSYYADRAELPVQLQSAPRPKIDRGAQPMAMAAPPPPAPAPAPRAALSMAAPSIQESETAVRAASFNQAGATTQPQAEESGAQVSFQLPGTFTLPAGQTLMAPLIAKPLALQRVSVYQPQTNATTPLAAVKLTNDSGVSLPAGILTIYAGERADFAGDAHLPNFPRGETRLISYALDQKVQIQRTESPTQSVAELSAAQGVLRASRKNLLDTIYLIKAPIDEPRLLVIEHPRRADYMLEEAGDAEVTPTHHRISVSLKPGESRSLRVRLSRLTEEQVRLIEMNPATTAFWSHYATTAANQQAIAAFTALANLRRAIFEVERRLNELEARVAAIKSDQERQRANLASAPRDSDLAKRSLTAISLQEDELGLLSKTRAMLESDRTKAQQALEAGVMAIKF